MVPDNRYLSPLAGRLAEPSSVRRRYGRASAQASQEVYERRQLMAEKRPIDFIHVSSDYSPTPAVERVADWLSRCQAQCVSTTRSRD